MAPTGQSWGWDAQGAPDTPAAPGGPPPSAPTAPAASSWDTWDTPTWESSASGPTTGWDGPRPTYLPPAPAPITGLWLALGAAVLGSLTGIALLILTDRPTTLAAAAAVVGWLLAGILPVLAIASYQRIDLRRAASIYYRPHPSAGLIRATAMVIGVVGVIANSLVFAEWLARL